MRVTITTSEGGNPNAQPLSRIDPYLECNTDWPDFHHRFIGYAAEELQPQLPPRYRARIDVRVVLEAEDRRYHPEVTVVERPKIAEARAAYRSSKFDSGIDEPVILTGLMEDLRESYLEIIDREGGRVITVIELISPTNKAGSGRLEYLAKRKTLLRSAANLAEIDLLREGDSMAPVLNLEPLRTCYSTIYVWRSDARRHEAYFVKLPQRLPRIRIPLLPDDSDVRLDIQSVFTRCYDSGRYDLDLDYAAAPQVSLFPEDAEWLDQHLRQIARR